MDPALEQMADALVESGDYRVIRRLPPRTEYHPPDDNPKLVAAVVDVETTGTDPEHDKIIALGMCVFEYGRSDGRIYRVIGSWNWLEDPGIPLPPEITRLTGITEQMVAGHRIDDAAVNDLLGKVVLVIAHHAAFDRGFLERRLPASRPNIGLVAFPTSTGEPRVSGRRRLNSSRIRSGSSMTGTGPRAIVGRRCMSSRNRFPKRVALPWRRFSKKLEPRLGDCGRGTLRSRRRIC